MTPEEIARLVAEASARRFAARAGSPVAAEDASARADGDDVWSATAFPAAVITVPFDGPVAGETLLVLAPDDLRALQAAMEPADADAEPGELDLEAVARLVDELIDGASATLPVTAGASSARLANDAGELRALEAGTIVVSYRLTGDGLAASVVQTVPAGLVEQFETSSAEPEEEPEQVAPEAPGEASISSDAAELVAVERTAALSAESATSVLSTLFSEELSAGTPAIEAHPSDPLGSFDFPVIEAEVSLLGDAHGAIRLILLPADAAMLAAAMMGTPETTGDGLSAIELSAVSEALNQVMTAMATELGAVLGISAEASPPACTIIETIEEARERVGDCAYRASFRLASTVFGAEIVQLFSDELAGSLRDAFDVLAQGIPDEFDDAALDAAFADLPLEVFGEEPSHEPEIRAGAREVLSGIRVRVSAELGRARLPVARVANLPAGSVVMLDRAPTDPVDVLVNGTPFAQARVVLVDGEYAVQILSLSPLELSG